MILREREYVIKRIEDLETITIDKKALEGWKAHYTKLMKKHQGDELRCRRLFGKICILDDILRLFVK